MSSKKSSNKDANHDDVKQAYERSGWAVVDTFHFNKFVDLIACDLEGLTISGTFNRQEVLDALSKIDGVHIQDGAFRLVEVKNPEQNWKLTPDQVKLHQQIPVIDIIEYTYQVLEMRKV